MEVITAKITATVSIECVTLGMSQPSGVRKVVEGRLPRTFWRGGASFLSGGCLAGGGCPRPEGTDPHLRSSLWRVVSYCFLFCFKYWSFSLNKHMFLGS